MSSSFKIGILFSLLLAFQVTTSALGQTDSTYWNPSLLALEKAELARMAFEDDKPQMSIRLMKEAQAMEPNNFIYAYEVGYMQYLVKDYVGAVATLEALIDHPDVTPQYFQILGNAFLMVNNKMAANEAFQIGLSHFPHAGELFLEKGNLSAEEHEIGKALFDYNKGIELDPNYAMNYYKAAMIYFDQGDLINGLIHGELFMNLDKTSPFNELMSIKILEKFQKSITFSNPGGNIITHFCDQNKNDIPLDWSALKDNSRKCEVFATLYQNLQLKNTEMSIAQLLEIQMQISSLYHEDKIYNTWQDNLLDYHDIIMQSGNFEAYWYWLFRKGNEAEFLQWRKANMEKWNAFCEWYNRFQLEFPEPEN
jgi:hypothetical protein